jgi:hypothetical protein
VIQNANPDKIFQLFQTLGFGILCADRFLGNRIRLHLPAPQGGWFAGFRMWCESEY